MNKKILYIDMDGVVADFDKAIKRFNPGIHTSDYESTSDMVDIICANNPGIFHNLPEIPGSIEIVKKLFPLFDVYFLSTPMWHVPDSFTGKRIWLEEKFGDLVEKRLILTHRKDLCIGDYLVDDRTKNGVDLFRGRHIHFATNRFPTWESVYQFLILQEVDIKKDDLFVVEFKSGVEERGIMQDTFCVTGSGMSNGSEVFFGTSPTGRKISFSRKDIIKKIN